MRLRLAGVRFEFSVSRSGVLRSGLSNPASYDPAASMWKQVVVSSAIGVSSHNPIALERAGSVRCV